jgi:RNA polymerase sigma-70 factor (ECF subfamily)
MLDDGDLVQDCLQDVFLRAFRAYSRLDAKANIRAWLYKIATNTAYSMRKREAKIAASKVGLDFEQLEDGDTPHGRYEIKERLEEVAHAVMSLPKKQQAAILLRKYQELPYSEIARILDSSESAARANVYQGLRTLRRKLGRKVKGEVVK